MAVGSRVVVVVSALGKVAVVRVVVAGAVGTVARLHLGKLDPILFLPLLLGLGPAHAHTGPGGSDWCDALRGEGLQRCSVDQEKSYEKRWPHERQLGVEAVCQP